MLDILSSDPLSLVTYSGLFMALVSLWALPKSRVWLVLVTLSAAIGWYAGRLTWIGVLEGAILGAACYAYNRKSTHHYLRPVIAVFIIGVSYLLKTHELPGFNNWLVHSAFTYSPDSTPDRLSLNFDAPLVGLFILGFGYSRISTLTEWGSVIKKTIPLVFITTIVMLGPALWSGFVRLDLKWFDFSPVWLLINLVFTCVVEEAYFRGFIQRELGHVFRGFKWAGILALIVASIIFGLFHYRGNWTYVALATLAGLFYGFAYLRTQRLESSILVHFAVNAIHFITFSYPALQKLG